MAKIRRRKRSTPAAPPGGYGKGGVPQIGEDSGFWLAAGETGGGTANAQQGTLWGGVPYGFVSNGVVQTIMVETPRQNLQFATAPNKARLVIDFIDGAVDPYLQQVAALDQVNVFCGIYVGEYVSATNLYDTQDPTNPAEVSREWLYIEGRSLYAYQTTTSIVVTQTHPIFNLTGAVDVVLEGGEALMLAVGCNNVNAGTIVVFAANIRIHFAEPT
jgi:hypothetical protein